MTTHNVNDDNNSIREKLTILLTSLFNFLESESTKHLPHSGVNLRGDFERYICFDSVLCQGLIYQLYEHVLKKSFLIQNHPIRNFSNNIVLAGSVREPIFEPAD